MKKSAISMSIYAIFYLLIFTMIACEDQGEDLNLDDYGGVDVEDNTSGPDDSHVSTTYYLDSDGGDDANTGTTPTEAFRTLKALDSLNFGAGDSILLARGTKYQGSIVIENMHARSERQLVISSYGDTSKPRAIIDCKGYRAAVDIMNSGGVKVSHLELTGNGSGGAQDIEATRAEARTGIFIELKVNPGYVFESIVLDSLYIHDVFKEEPGFDRPDNDTNTSNGEGSYGYGIRLVQNKDAAELHDLLIQNCKVENVSHTGIRLTGHSRRLIRPRILHCKVRKSGGPALQVNSGVDMLISYCDTDQSGYVGDERNWKRGSGFWCWGCKGLIVQHCRFTNANGPADSAGAHIDFNNNDVIFQYNFSANNAGGFVEVLGVNYNCSYRYNVSVNDGWRVNKVDGAHQWGNILWLSGYAGAGTPPSGPFNTYIYNNTIYTHSDKQAITNFQNTAVGIGIYNNIFHVRDKMTSVTAGELKKENVNFKNNLFLSSDSWDKKEIIQDSQAQYGDADFVNPNGMKIEDYVPQNVSVIQNRGLAYDEMQLMGDFIGLEIGLAVEKDILGNPIVGKPDMGAIEM